MSAAALSGPVTQRLAAESCSITIILVTPEGQSFKQLSLRLLPSFPPSCICQFHFRDSPKRVSSATGTHALHIHHRIKMSLAAEPDRSGAVRPLRRKTSPTVFPVAIGTDRKWDSPLGDCWKATGAEDGSDNGSVHVCVRWSTYRQFIVTEEDVLLRL